MRPEKVGGLERSRGVIGPGFAPSMPRYFFHLRDERYTPDEIGEDLTGPAAADRETLRISGELLRDIPADSEGITPISVICTDESGAVVAAVLVSRLSPVAGQGLLEDWRRQSPD